MELTMDKIVAHAKQYGFVYQGSEIYNGLANTWDYGPLGVELKNNIKQLWWKEFITKNPNNIGIDSAIFMNSNVWRASGHVGGFSDPLIDCKECKTRHRADKIIEDFDQNLVGVDGWTNEVMSQFIVDNNITCPDCGELNFTEIRQFDLMFNTNMGVVASDTSKVYLRPETAQGIFVNFKNLQRTSRRKVPFGVGQIGKSFRNEITPGNFIFRTREFEQMEIEFFCKPGSEFEWFDFYTNKINDFLTSIGFTSEEYRLREHDEAELSHYSNKTSDFEFKFPFGWGELWGLASRTDFDLKAHEVGSSQDLHYRDPVTNEKYLPFVVEPSVGVDRLFLAVLTSAYKEEILEDGDVREVLKISPKLAPVKVAVLPLVKKLAPQALELFETITNNFNAEYDDAGKIGKRYRRQDVIGTPLCVTYDYDTLEDDMVTVRDRDTMEQTKVHVDDLVTYINSIVNA